MDNLPLRHIPLILFNLLPLALIIDGYWQPFDALAFYWLELIAVCFFGTLGNAMSAIYQFSQKNIGAGIGQTFGTIFFPLHFGFFLVMLCFPIGSFLPPGTPTRPLTDPLVPLRVVTENMPFFEMLPIVMVWQCFVFITRFILSGRYKQDAPAFVLSAYGSLAVLFVSAFFGVLIGLSTGNRIWGAVILVALKTLIAYLVARHRPAEKSQTEENPAASA